MTPPKPTTNSEEFYWREPILPRKQSCPVLLTPFVQPSQVERDSIRFDVDIRFDQISFEAEWDPPKYLNGDLDHYELCARFGDVELEGQEMCDSEDIHVPNVAMPSSNVPPQEIKGPMLIMQVINYGLPSTSLPIYIQCSTRRDKNCHILTFCGFFHAMSYAHIKHITTILNLCRLISLPSHDIT